VSEQLSRERRILHADLGARASGDTEGRGLPRQLVQLGLILRRAAATALITPTQRSRGRNCSGRTCLVPHRPSITLTSLEFAIADSSGLPLDGPDVFALRLMDQVPRPHFLFRLTYFQIPRIDLRKIGSRRVLPTIAMPDLMAAYSGIVPAAVEIGKEALPTLSR
jgi:hypothetical protein